MLQLKILCNTKTLFEIIGSIFIPRKIPARKKPTKKPTNDINSRLTAKGNQKIEKGAERI